jgi:hypothetical protein
VALVGAASRRPVNLVLERCLAHGAARSASGVPGPDAADRRQSRMARGGGRLAKEVAAARRGPGPGCGGGLSYRYFAEIERGLSRATCRARAHRQCQHACGPFPAGPSRARSPGTCARGDRAAYRGPLARAEPGATRIGRSQWRASTQQEGPGRAEPARASTAGVTGSHPAGGAVSPPACGSAPRGVRRGAA